MAKARGKAEKNKNTEKIKQISKTIERNNIKLNELKQNIKSKIFIKK